MMNAEKDFYSKGLAVGFCDIRTDTWHYRFRAETFELPANTGYTTFFEHGMPVMKVDRVRELAQGKL